MDASEESSETFSLDASSVDTASVDAASVDAFSLLASSVEVVEDVEKAFGRALEVKGDDGMLFCVGSLYLVGEIKDVIRRNKK